MQRVRLIAGCHPLLPDYVLLVRVALQHYGLLPEPAAAAAAPELGSGSTDDIVSETPHASAAAGGGLHGQLGLHCLAPDPLIAGLSAGVHYTAA